MNPVRNFVILKMLSYGFATKIMFFRINIKDLNF